MWNCFLEYDDIHKVSSRIHNIRSFLANSKLEPKSQETMYVLDRLAAITQVVASISRNYIVTVSLSLYLSLCLSVSLSLCLSASLSFLLTSPLSVLLSLCISVSVCVSLFPSHSLPPPFFLILPVIPAAYAAVSSSVLWCITYMKCPCKL